MTQKYCAWLNEISRCDVAFYGGKGANLGDMSHHGLKIPPGFVVSCVAYQKMMQDSGLDLQISEMVKTSDLDNTKRLQGIERRSRQLIENIPIDEELRHVIMEFYKAMGEDIPVAVRSSATAEDLPGASFAGQQDTFLNVAGEEALVEAFKKCWSSLFTSRAIVYRQQNHFDTQEASMAVVVQRMIDPEKSGVLFTVDPVLGNRFHMVIEAVWGLGEAIVSGMVTPDNYNVDRENFDIVSEYVPEKKLMVVSSKDGGTEIRKVPLDRRSAHILGPNEIEDLVDFGNRVEKHFGCPQDIEWGISGGEIYLLQSRPITNI